MSGVRRYLLIALSFAIAVTALAIFAPRTVHAIAATFVQVVNTAANPIAVQPVPAKQAVYMHATLNLYDNHQIDSVVMTDNNGVPYSVPAGKRLVIESSTAHCGLPVGQKLFRTELTSGVSMGYHVQFDGTWNSTDFYTLLGNAPVYIDQFGNLSFVTYRYPSSASGTCDVSASGHLEDIQ